jgi:P27 family predicted phage terminase small subunit
MGRNKTPLRILKLHGSRRIKNRHEPELPFLEQLPKPPSYLKGHALRFYRRVGASLISARILTELDMMGFVLMCEDFDFYKRAAALCKKLRTITLETNNGAIVQHPAVGIRNRAQETLRRTMKSFGLVPGSRANLTFTAEKPEDPFAALSRRGRKKDEPKKGPYGPV